MVSARASSVEWLHQSVQRSAGLGETDDPLSFSQLHGAKGYPPPWMQPPPEAGSEGAWSINLQMVTTNLTHGRPYQLPRPEGGTRLFFKRGELEDYLPPRVLEALVRSAPPYAPREPGDPAQARHGDEELHQLPTGDLPIVVAARLSLSFPFLFSAVPLWAIDHEAPPAQRDFAPCLFSDGGICSNFPIHLFDAAVPRWPTFGIFLGRRGVHEPDRPFWLPATHREGRHDIWNRPDSGDTGTSPLGEFIGHLVSSAKDWNDRIAMRMPGVRDRVLRVGLRGGEGELNLVMRGAEIRTMAHDYGTEGGRELVQRYTDPQAAGRLGVAWDEHRWVRFNTLLFGLRERLWGLQASAADAVHGQPLGGAIRRAFLERPLREGEEGPDPSGAALNAGQADALEQSLHALETLAAAFQSDRVAQPYEPEPKPKLRMRPPL